MTAIRPCRHCHRSKSCPEKKDKQKALRGLGLTLADFRCALPFLDFRPGERVSAELDDYWELECGYHESTRRMVNGTVLRWKERQRKVLVQFDEEIGTAKGDEAIRILAMWPNRLTKLDELPRELCPCGFGQKADGGCDLPDGFTCYEDGADPDLYRGPPPAAAAAVKENDRLLAEWEARQ